MSDSLTTAQLFDQFTGLGHLHGPTRNKLFVASQDASADKTSGSDQSADGARVFVVDTKKDPAAVALGDRLRLAIREAGIPDMETLAQRIGYAGPRVRNWANGTSPMRVPEAIRLRELFGVTLDWLYLGVTEGLSEYKRIRFAALRSGVTPPPDDLGPAEEPVEAIVPVLQAAAKKSALKAKGKRGSRSTRRKSKTP